MTRYTYPAIITYYPDAVTYVVTFPDFPELVVADDNIVDALDGMNNMLEVYIEDLIDHGKSLPEPTTFSQNLHQGENCVSWWTIAHCDVDDDVVVKTDLTVESMGKVIGRYREAIAQGSVVPVNKGNVTFWIDNGISADDPQAAFHANRPVTSDNDQ